MSKRTVIIDQDNEAFIRSVWSARIRRNDKDPTFSSSLNMIIRALQDNRRDDIIHLLEEYGR